MIRTTATIEDLDLKSSLLPEGPDIFRLTSDEIKAQFETGPAAYDLTHIPLDRQLDGERLAQPLFGEKQEPTEEKEIEAIVERASEDIWTHPRNDRVEVVGAKVVAATRDREKMAYSHRWIFEVAPVVQAEVFVIPDVISIDGLKVTLKGRYKPAAWEYIPPHSAQKDPDGWSMMANINYDFGAISGSLEFS